MTTNRSCLTFNQVIVINRDIETIVSIVIKILAYKLER